MSGSSHVSRSRAIRTTERKAKATNTHTDSETDTELDSRIRTQRVDGTFHTPYYENIEEFRRRTWTNSLTGNIETEEEEDKEIYNTKRKILSPASEEREKKRADCRTDSMQYQQTPIRRSTLTKRTPPEQNNNTEIKDKNMDEEETGKKEEGINRKDWDALVSLVQKVATDLRDIKQSNESIRTEQINIRKEQTETRKEIEELKAQTEKNAREVEERYTNLEKRTEKLEAEIKENIKGREEEIKKMVEETIEEKLSKDESNTNRKGDELEKEIKMWKRKQEDKWEKDERIRRRNNVIITGLKHKGSDAKKEIEEWLGQKLTEGTRINRIWKVPGNRGKIGVECKDTEQKDRIMKLKKQLKGSDIYIDNDRTWKVRDNEGRVREWAKTQEKEGTVISTFGTRVKIDEEEWILDERTEKMKPFLRKRKDLNVEPIEVEE